MRDKIKLPDELTVRQDAWEESPCRECVSSPCCLHLPLTTLYLDNRSSFINLALLACYDQIRIGLKNSFEWTIYYHSTCRFLDRVTSRCTIHGKADQSIVCKTYNARNCWYKPAFHAAQNEKIIFFDLNRLIILEKQNSLLENGFSKQTMEWNDLVSLYSGETFHVPLLFPQQTEEYPNVELDFSDCTADRYLFFPPFEKPAREIHFELMKFRLGFRGVALVYADNFLAYMTTPRFNGDLFKQLTSEYFPSLQPAHGQYGFSQLHKEKSFFSSVGEKWLVLRKEHIPVLKMLTQFDAFGNVKKLPRADELQVYLSIRFPRKPDKAA
ncbi:MAG: hypothetical protein JW904_14745 [Spirochaetales bacterium]|nr:hypothetical protein [Spirochaetales bacterium]